jgi:hypothetical protein
MSALGQKRTLPAFPGKSALPLKADIPADASFVPIGDIGRLVSPLAFSLLMDTSAASVSCTFGHTRFQGVAFGILGAAI